MHVVCKGRFHIKMSWELVIVDKRMRADKRKGIICEQHAQIEFVYLTLYNG